MTTCIVCGSAEATPPKRGSKREDIACPSCSARRRDLDQAQAILGLISDGTAGSLSEAVEGALASGKDLRILEVALTGPFIAVLGKLPGYVQGYRWPGGQDRRAQPRAQPLVQHCDLEALSHDDNSFDLVITSEVLPFVENESKAHGEIRRVLKPGGAHVATFSLDWPAPLATEEFFAADGADAPPPAAPKLFKSPDGESLPLRRKYGMDLLPRLKKDGFFAAFRREGFLDREGRRNVTLVAVKA